MNVLSPVISSAKPAEVMEPVDRPFNDPAMDSHTTAVFVAALGQVRCDAKPVQQITSWL